MNYEISPNLKRILSKLSKKDPLTYERILKKIHDISNSNPEHYKNLTKDLKEFKQVQIGPFVLVFNFIKENSLIIFQDFDHHDKVYLKRYS